MVITYHGHQFFKLQYGDTVLALDPPSADSEYKSARFGADIVLSSVRHPDFMGRENLTAGDKDPFIIYGPGEYEVQEIFIKGLSSKTQYDGDEGVNTIYYFNMEGMDILFLGALGSTNLDPEVLEVIDNVDVLFIPLGEEGVLDPVEAYKFGVKLEANIIIPMHYNETQLGVFLKEEGTKKKKAEDKLTIKPSDVSGKEGEIIILSQS
ncbi:MAG: MBL fold metallo-hydrolase [Candidatus Paceibacterota bacterium]